MWYCNFVFVRDGLISTAAKTSTSGYIQRRITVALEALCVKYDSTIRDAQGNMVQAIYGDGFDGVYLEKVFMYYLEKPIEPNQFTEKELVVYSNLKLESIKNKLSLLNNKLDCIAYVPVNIEAILLQESYCNKQELNEEKVIEAVQGVLSKFKALKCNTLYMRTSFAYFLRWQTLKKYSILTFNKLLDTIDYHCNRAFIQPGEMVGNLAAESIGEPV